MNSETVVQGALRGLAAVGWTERAGTVRNDRGYQFQGLGWSLVFGFEEIANNLHRTAGYFGRAEVNGGKWDGL